MTETEIVFKLVHSDERRDIYSNIDLLNGKEVSIIKLKAGKAIGGCVHLKDEGFAILKGEGFIEWGEEKSKYTNDNLMTGNILKWTPHAFYAEEDSIIIEWGITPEEKKNSPKDEELLNSVKEYNEDIHSV